MEHSGSIFKNPNYQVKLKVKVKIEKIEKMSIYLDPDKELAKLFVNRVIDSCRGPNSPLVQRIETIRRKKSVLIISSINGVSIAHWRAAWDHRKRVEEKLNREFIDARYYFTLYRSTTIIDDTKYYNYSLQIRWRSYLKCC